MVTTQRAQKNVPILEALTAFLSNICRANTVYVAYSGGVDSHVLLHALAGLRDPYRFNLHAVHVHHGLLPHADQWAKHCEKIGTENKIAYTNISVTVRLEKGDSIEEAARTARYQALANLLNIGDLLFVAHHQDDQAETCLLQCLRGSGPRGLASMPTQIPFAKGLLIRPFLNTSRQMILNYARQHQLTWVEDESNHDIRFSRNFLRYRVMPLLKERWPSAGHSLMQVASHAAEAETLLQTLAEIDFKQAYQNVTNTLSIDYLRSLPFIRQKNLLRYWFYQKKMRMPSTQQLEQIIPSVIDAKQDATPCLRWKNTEVHRYQNQLYLNTISPTINSSLIIPWPDYRTPLMLPNALGTLTAEIKTGEGIDPEKMQHITVRFRQGGETCKLPYRTVTHSLKKLFQAWKIPTWQRAHFPLVYIEEQLANIPNYIVCRNFLLTDKKKAGVTIHYHQPNQDNID
ncbi:MAG: tRNA lysidine(34) synthetase TilS [Gammaproteobacteria bacterium GWF2_41_13]|nr:MAG: tRNA lysidine(34) synthetase TilS [Gammaproteobacteria bacterium GWF2_41_13]